MAYLILTSILLMQVAIGEAQIPTMTWLSGDPPDVDASDPKGCLPSTLVYRCRASFSLNYLQDSIQVVYQSPDGGFDLEGSLYLLCNMDLVLAGTSAEYTITFQVTSDGGHKANHTLTINVINLPTADPAPSGDLVTSPENGSVIEISELSVPGAAIVAMNASKGSNMDFTFSLLSMTQAFEVIDNILRTASSIVESTFDIDDGQDSALELVLNITDNTDQSSYEIYLTVNIQDENDNAPIFTSPAAFYVNETTQGPVTVGTVGATDKDRTAPNNRVTFTLSDSSVFNIDPTTGELSLNDGVTLDYYVQNEYVLVVTATDGNTNAMKRTTNQTITINIKTRRVKFITPENGTIFSVSESTGASHVITPLSAKQGEIDTGFHFIIVNPSSPFAIAGQSLATSTNLAADDLDVDNGQATIYHLTIRATIGEDSKEIVVTVQIDDINDNRPTFTDIPTLEILEESTGGTVLGQFNASDNDRTSPNNDITFTMEESSIFNVDPRTGKLFLQVGQSLNYTAQATYTVNVTITDGGAADGALSDSRTLTVYVRTAPVFTELNVNQSISLREDYGPGRAFYDILVQDKDRYPSAPSITILTEFPQDGFFEVRGSQLYTSLASSLDADTTNDEYWIVFSVTDGEFIRNSSYLHITLIDKNDERPVFTSTRLVAIEENRALGSLVATLVATDADKAAPFNTLTYSIIDGNDSGVFRLNETSGEVFLEQAPMLRTYRLRVKVVDGGTPALDAEMELTISINEDAVDECVMGGSAACGNNSEGCVPSVNSYICACKTGWTGRHCETNIDDCSPNQCENNGTCMDDVATFSCDCAPGWRGALCTEECSGNTFGRNCLRTCSCNASRLANDVTDQQCDIITGACKCSAQWRGSDCSNDTNECLDPDICQSSANYACENMIGTFECVCKQGYTSNNARDACILAATPNPVTDINEQREIAVKIRVGSSQTPTIKDDGGNDVLVTERALEVPFFYERTKSVLKAMVQRGLPVGKRIYISNIRAGSISFDAHVVIDNTEEQRSTLAVEIQELRNGNPLQSGDTRLDVTSLSVKDASLPVSSGKKSGTVCEVYVALSPCSDGYRCNYDDAGEPYCRKMTSEDHDPTSVILGLGISMLLIVLIMAAIIIIVFKLRGGYKQDKRRSVSSSTIESRNSFGDGHLALHMRPDYFGLRPEYTYSYQNPQKSPDQKPNHTRHSRRSRHQHLYEGPGMVDYPYPTGARNPAYDMALDPGDTSHFSDTRLDRNSSRHKK